MRMHAINDSTKHSEKKPPKVGNWNLTLGLLYLHLVGK